VQDDLLGGTESVSVIPFTTLLIDAPLMWVRVAASFRGAKKQATR
jgi:hypothetical protein